MDGHLSTNVNNLAYLSSNQLTKLYLHGHRTVIMNQKQAHWNYQVRAPFRKVMAWDALFFVLGIGVGAGIGAFLATL
ncbi:hypothetical protein DSQ19_07615 [Candidatus Nitrosotenuis sp. DW1]|nr:hypothetical protein DSQ19_07615 [Candidatus Nitrosotenuis sp. DW1]